MRFGTVEGDSGPLVVAADGDAAVLMTEFRDVEAVLGADSAQVPLPGARVDPAGLSWLPPVLRPGKVLCVALNNSANPERIISGPDTPAMFVKPSSSLVGHGRPIRIRPEDGRVHPEPELAVLIGRGGANIPEKTALSHVFGYTILNDVTSPTMRGQDTFHYRAIHPGTDGGVRYVESWVSYPARYKGADTFGPLGPWVVTADEIPDPHDLRITCSHNGNLITDDTTANLRFSVAEVISYASRYLALEPGDVIGMGTALRNSGGAVQNVDLNRLGGQVEVSIEGIGTLSNPVERR
ncbi:fumarylacetoacetate hydrolase family protein [Amycolatopsis jejuensis]|uniref:fumarylacetoacetate hydrolase family protein n=1 Tax=Amycolatopsis jejuensis TaxID=330084 RepID=UPI000527E4EF|nr:fumarylacetoacetate hydrolase family protein [Amycolatopsis jejuensis]